MNFLYLYINLGSIIIPLIFSFHPKIKFYKEWKFIFPGIVLSGILYLIWDIVFTRNGIWGFNPIYITGFKVINLPVEEVLFFVSIPFASLFTHYCITRLFPKFRLSVSITKGVGITLIIVFLIVATLFRERDYTFINFTVTACVVTLSYCFRPKLLSSFLLTYLLILIPFFLVNGILTGSFIKDEVVWYDNAENLGIRLGTIPVEDVFYGLGVLLLGQFFAEVIKRK